MRIHFDEAHRLFHLRTSEMSYAFGIAADGRLRHLYWGSSLSSDDSLLPLAETMLAAYEPSKGVDARKDGVAELPTMEPSDYGDPVLWARHPDGTRGLRLLYDSHLIDGDHLTVVARDAAYAVTVELHYRGWADLPLLSKWLVIRNGEEGALELEQMKSAAWQTALWLGLSADPSERQLGLRVHQKSADADSGPHRAAKQPHHLRRRSADPLLCAGSGRRGHRNNGAGVLRRAPLERQFRYHRGAAVRQNGHCHRRREQFRHQVPFEAG